MVARVPEGGNFGVASRERGVGHYSSGSRTSSVRGGLHRSTSGSQFFSEESAQRVDVARRDLLLQNPTLSAANVTACGDRFVGLQCQASASQALVLYPGSEDQAAGELFGQWRRVGVAADAAQAQVDQTPALTLTHLQGLLDQIVVLDQAAKALQQFKTGNVDEVNAFIEAGIQDGALMTTLTDSTGDLGDGPNGLMGAYQDLSTTLGGAAVSNPVEFCNRVLSLGSSICDEYDALRPVFLQTLAPLGNEVTLTQSGILILLKNTTATLRESVRTEDASYAGSVESANPYASSSFSVTGAADFEFNFETFKSVVSGMTSLPSEVYATINDFVDALEKPLTQLLAKASSDRSDQGQYDTESGGLLAAILESIGDSQIEVGVGLALFIVGDLLFTHIIPWGIYSQKEKGVRKDMVNEMDRWMRSGRSATSGKSFEFVVRNGDSEQPVNARNCGETDDYGVFNSQEMGGFITEFNQAQSTFKDNVPLKLFQFALQPHRYHMGTPDEIHAVYQHLLIFYADFVKLIDIHNRRDDSQLRDKVKVAVAGLLGMVNALGKIYNHILGKQGIVNGWILYRFKCIKTDYALPETQPSRWVRMRSRLSMRPASTSSSASSSRRGDAVSIPMTSLGQSVSAIPGAPPQASTRSAAVFNASNPYGASSSDA